MKESDTTQTNCLPIQPTFNENLLSPEKIISHVQDLVKVNEPISHAEILTALIEQFEPLDFELLAFPEVAELRKELAETRPDGDRAKVINIKLAAFKVNKQHLLVLAIENIKKVAETNSWGVCKNNNFIYLFNSAYWSCIDKEAFQDFLGEASEKMGVTWVHSRYYQFKEHLFKQFMSAGFLPNPEPQQDKVLINLKNGTFEVTQEGTFLRPFDIADFIKYQLPFEYDPKASAPIFHKYLDRVLPDIKGQMVLSEFLGYVFTKHGGRTTKEEKALVLYGPGANGKSVLNEIVNSLLGDKNVSSYSLQSITNESGYFRAMLANTLVNYASEINGNLNPAIFKQLCSGEPVEARLPYGQPFTLKQYAKLIFNCNELPKEVEHTKAFFRRFLIIPFEVIIPEEEQDKHLHTKIIDAELSGVFNWVLEGLTRLLKNQRFTPCDAIRAASEDYEKQSDSVRLLLEECDYKKNNVSYMPLKDLYTEFKSFCFESGFKPLNIMNFSKRLRSLGIMVERKNFGNVVFVVKDVL